MIIALKKPQLLRLWFGQALSSIGDEIYRVGLVWLAVGLMGPNAGYLAAGQTASLMLLSFFGGRWADHWNPWKTMISVDLIRAIMVLVPVVLYYFIGNSLIVLWIMAFSVSGLSAFFDPATQGLIPVLAIDKELMQATNGLMSTTIRLARMIGPAIVGLLSAFIPMIHFFTIDAITFCISAYCVYSLKKYIPEEKVEIPKEKVSFKETILSGYNIAKKIPGMEFILYTKALTVGGWYMVLTIGFPLLVHQSSGGNARYFGFVMASYGIGNFIGALYFGNKIRKNLWSLHFYGQLFLGVGFLAIAMSPSVNYVIVAAALSGFTGPMNDLAFLDMMQEKFKVSEITKLFRLRLGMESGMALIFMLISPWLIKATSVRTAIVIGGTVWIICGAMGLVLGRRFRSLFT
ncbi:MAG: MFS transporter [Bdellovibrionales bacterium]|nr:MFS transporter [Bdellovibrionales bacterium]